MSVHRRAEQPENGSVDGNVVLGQAVGMPEPISQAQLDELVASLAPGWSAVLSQRTPEEYEWLSEVIRRRGLPAHYDRGTGDALLFPEPPLTAGEIVVRPSRDSDAAVQAGWGTDVEILRWTAVPKGYTEAAARDWQAQMERDRFAGRGIAFTVALAGTDEPVGSIDLRLDPKDPRIGEIGYLVAEPFRRQGVARTAIALVAGWGFQTIGLARVQALVHPANDASHRVLAALGFQREGLLRSYRDEAGGREDRVVWSLLPGELATPDKPAA
jgi:RimJ/RimL family protein N-acetyltransferase